MPKNSRDPSYGFVPRSKKVGDQNQTLGCIFGVGSTWGLGSEKSFLKKNL